jgi:hypothetical protein
MRLESHSPTSPPASPGAITSGCRSRAIARRAASNDRLVDALTRRAMLHGGTHRHSAATRDVAKANFLEGFQESPF